jgi:D-alanyl-D-alanine dipeptidase
MMRRQSLFRHGFASYDCEWWHFSLADEPYPDTYFNFPVKTLGK